MDPGELVTLYFNLGFLRRNQIPSNNLAAPLIYQLLHVRSQRRRRILGDGSEKRSAAKPGWRQLDHGWNFPKCLFKP